MEDDQFRILLGSVLFERELRLREKIKSNNDRFVHYTSAEVAASIIQNRSIWMRNALTMNDYSEIQYGQSLVSSVLDTGSLRLRFVLDEISPSILPLVVDQFYHWFNSIQFNTFLACFSEHDPEEDQLGRLSMWRAYGSENGVAIVVNSGPFLREGSPMHVYSTPVAYQNEKQFLVTWRDLLDRMHQNKQSLKQTPLDMIVDWMFMLMRTQVLGTKHPGFAEEREWRAFYTPTFQASQFLKRKVRTVRGVPQIVFEIPLLIEAGTEITTYLDRIIVGPSKQPLTIQQTLDHLMTEAGFQDADRKTFVSGIPLRI